MQKLFLMNALSHDWLKLAHAVARSVDSKENCYYLPLEKGVALHLNNIESISSNDTLAVLSWQG